MDGQFKQFLIVLPVSLVLAGTASLLYFLDPTFVPDLWRITSMIIVILWAFFIIPSTIFVIRAITKRWKNLRCEQAFREGVLLGLLGGTLVIVGILISPVTGTFWYIQAVKDALLSQKNKKKYSDNPKENDDIFDM